MKNTYLTMTDIVDFESLNLPIPEIIKIYSIEKQREIYSYLSEMDELNIVAYKIAVNHLKSSFDIYRSNGFIEWKKKQSK